MSQVDREMLSSKIGRRSFLKMAALSSAVGASGLIASANVTREATSQELSNPYPNSKKVKTVCTACSVGCGIIAEVENGVWVRQEVAQDHPISLGGHCCKGSDMVDMVRSAVRLKYPMVKENGEWKRISYNEALDRIAEQLNKYQKENPEQVMFLGSAKMSNEQCYYIRKFGAFFGTNNVDHQARI
ncbi:Formate dehydrogenase-O%2C major subunit @ selenocysteine-containing [Campylobacter geochelonis]|uniref:Formate dehydrogenase-O, major subunit @ selenocysteine-containing n=2 Tax=Campylobacter geochelonis TaxID=1780362 RepID=A0A128ELP3_9BACT|nr:Formate dehydrogenase-O%2C major subunit @ selenocysteine-containing [Campylobacter geochelonis]CZE46883.1 Formate dehydrogenase-O%2C major subunit @ selenocysteine-containing [Campylobacter geochelonis]CZE49888.1 Formate dehydrogenase-O%2C major subunit @ selenocysteine-containing [Campylobacter geochelonis]